MVLKVPPIFKYSTWESFAEVFFLEKIHKVIIYVENLEPQTGFKVQPLEVCVSCFVFFLCCGVPTQMHSQKNIRLYFYARVLFVFFRLMLPVCSSICRMLKAIWKWLAFMSISVSVVLTCFSFFLSLAFFLTYFYTTLAFSAFSLGFCSRGMLLQSVA